MTARSAPHAHRVYYKVRGTTYACTECGARFKIDRRKEPYIRADDPALGKLKRTGKSEQDHAYRKLDAPDLGPPEGWVGEFVRPTPEAVGELVERFAVVAKQIARDAHPDSVVLVQPQPSPSAIALARNNPTRKPGKRKGSYNIAAGTGGSGNAHQFFRGVRLPKLARDEELRLATIIRTGENPLAVTAAKNELIGGNLHRLQRFLRMGKKLPDCHEYLSDEVIGDAGLEGMYAAVAGFDPGLGNRFWTYAEPWVRKFIILAAQPPTLERPRPCHRRTVFADAMDTAGDSVETIVAKFGVTSHTVQNWREGRSVPQDPDMRLRLEARYGRLSGALWMASEGRKLEVSEEVERDLSDSEVIDEITGRAPYDKDNDGNYDPGFDRGRNWE